LCDLGLTCGRTKATAVIKEMSAMQMASLAQRMREKPYSIATDGHWTPTGLTNYMLISEFSLVFFFKAL